MTSISLNIDLRKSHLRDLDEMVTGPQSRTRLNYAMGEGVRERTRDYLIDESGKRHKTAQRLGATPTGHLERAFRSVEGAPIEAGPDSATLILNTPGLGRAFHDVTIAGPHGQTIPIDAIAYGRRAGEFGNLFIWRSKTTGNAFLAMRDPGHGSRPRLIYLLVRSVTQPQDRTLLPSLEQWQQAAIDAADAWFHTEINAVNGNS